ncbi:MAG: GNAT family N-acetyltransferase [Bacteroidia bacterium]|nr:GNAT family N-acetyltransferase [Bacteroidia bacterium]
MIVKQYGLTYKRIQEEDLELIRYWRNRDFIRKTMQFQEYITFKMQRAWFQKINNKYNYYFLIEDNQKKIGLINCKDTDKNRVAEGGIFFWEKSYWNTFVPALASLTMLQVIFEEIKSGDTSIITVRKDNLHALKFNQYLGYSVYYEDDKVFKLKLSIEDYLTKTCKIKRAAQILVGKDNSTLQIIAQPSELLDEKVNEYLRKQNKK